MVMSSSCCEKVGLKKGPWTPEEDHKLMAFIQQHGHGSWRALPAKAGLERCGKSCRLRWTNYLRPDIKRGKFSLQEEKAIIQLHALLGNKWSAIAAHLPKRTDNEIKNYWNTHLKKRLIRLGIDPTTHKPMTNDAVNGQSKDAANLSHMAQWESARLEAEARLVKESKLQLENQLGSSSSQPALTRLVLNKITPQPSLPPCLDVLKAWQNSWTTSDSSTPTKDYTKMQSMYAIMLATTDDLESPTSTLSFPETILPNSKCNSNTITTSEHIKQSLVPPSTAAAANDSGIMIEGSDSEPWGNTMPSLRDDDIMVAVEAFRSRGGGHDEKCADMEGLHSGDVLFYVPSENPPQENLGILNVRDGGSTDFEEKHYWNTILNFVNDLP